MDGRVVSGHPVHQRGVGFVFQHYALFKHATAEKNIAFGLEVRKWPRGEIQKRVRELLDLVQLRGYEDRYPSQLSGGPAAARRPREGAGPAAQRASPRRAVRCARREGAPQSRRAAPRAPQGGPHDDDLRDARSGGSHRDRGRDRRDQPRDAWSKSALPPRSTIVPRRSSSPVSSATST